MKPPTKIKTIRRRKGWPKWAKWAAKDCDGSCYAYATKPRILAVPLWGPMNGMVFIGPSVIKGDWRKSLRRIVP